MSGAGSLIAANYIYNKAKPDGLTVGHFVGGQTLAQFLGKKSARFEGHKFGWIGTPVTASGACALTKASGITNLEEWYAAKKPIRIGATAPGALTDGLPRILKLTLKLPLRIIQGYKGTSKIRLAAESGEIGGGCWTWESIKATWRSGIKSGNIKIIIQAKAKKHPELPDVPNAADLVKTDEARQMLDVGIHKQLALLYAYSLPPGTPRDREKILRTAFMKTMKDPEFLADTKKSNLDINPMSGERVAKMIKDFSKMSPKLKANLSKIFVPKKK